MLKCFWLAHHNDWSIWFAISSPPRICCLGFSFIGGVAKEYITKLGCEKYFRRVTYWAPLEMLSGNKRSSLLLLLSFLCRVTLVGDVMSHIFFSCMPALLLCSTGHACGQQREPASIFAGTFTCLIDPRVNRHLHWSVPSTSWVRPLRGLLVNPKIVQFWFRERSNQKTNLRFLLPSRCCWFTQ